MSPYFYRNSDTMAASMRRERCILMRRLAMSNLGSWAGVEKGFFSAEDGKVGVSGSVKGPEKP